MKKGQQIHYFQWHITHACNLRCTHCYQDDYCSHTPEAELFRTLDMYTEFIDSTGLMPQINLTGGEPMLHPAFWGLAAEIRKRGYRLGVLTNGTLIDDEAAEKLSGLHPVFVQISLDGTKEIHDAIRGAGNFEKALRGIDLLKKHGVRVHVSFTAQKLNYKCLPELAAIAKEHQVDKLWWDRVVTDSAEMTERLALTTGQFKELTLTAQALHRKYRRPIGKILGGRFGTDRSMVSTSRALQMERCTADNCYICSAGRNLIIVLANGDVMPCRRLPFIIGNVKEKPLAEIIKSNRLMKELSLTRFPEACKGCSRLEYCHGGARCVTYAQTGKLYAKDVNCFYQ